MNRSRTVIIGAVALVSGAAVIILADQQGWFAAQQPSAAQPPAILTRTAPLPPTEPDVQAEVRLASNVTEVALLPRAQRAPSLVCSNHLKVVDLLASNAAHDAGIIVEIVREMPITHAVSCNAEIAFNADRMAHVSSRAPGVVTQVAKRAGDRVKAGETMALIDSTELGAAKGAVLQANTLVEMWSSTLERLRPLVEQEAVSRKEILAAETSLTEASIQLAQAIQQLRSLGVDQAGIDAVLAGDAATSILTVAAPFDGLIVERSVALQEAIDTQRSLFVVADTSTLWAMLDVRESDLRHVEVGQSALISLSGLAGETFAGEITWVSAAVDPATRMLKARADLANDQGVLRANMFGRAQIVVRKNERKLVVPKEAVQWDGCCNLVFVRQTDAIYQPFKVRLGADLGEHYVVDEGLEAGDRVVTRGAFLLKTELMKDSIGAGCCDVEGIKIDQ